MNLKKLNRRERRLMWIWAFIFAAIVMLTMRNSFWLDLCGVTIVGLMIYCLRKN
jgi:hypothetical protein